MAPDTKRKQASAQSQRGVKRLKAQAIFPFLELPGELRNRVYEFAVSMTASSWSMTRDNDARKSRRGRSRALPNEMRCNSKTPIPFLGFTQTCRQLRSEFRSMWLSSHRVYLTGLERYLSVFLPTPSTKESTSMGFTGTGKLKVFIRDSEMESGHCILRLLKLKAKFPNYNFIFNQGWDLPANFLADLNHIVNNRNTKWLQWIGSNTLCQCRIHDRRMVLVVHERYAEKWMKPSFGVQVPSGFLASFGLGALEKESPDLGLTVTFAVCYSC